MHKLLCGIALFGASATAHAQIAAGTKLLSGSIGYTSQQEEFSSSAPNSTTLETKQESFNLMPSVGYFIAENLAVGVQAGAVLSNRKGKEYVSSYTGGYYADFENSSRSLSGGLFARSYKFVGEKVALYGQLGAGYQNIYYAMERSGQFGGTSDNRLEGFYAQLLPGLVFFPSDKIGLELSLRGISYNRLTDKDEVGRYEAKTTNSNFDFGFGLNDLNLGISLYLGR